MSNHPEGPIVGNKVDAAQFLKYIPVAKDNLFNRCLKGL